MAIYANVLFVLTVYTCVYVYMCVHLLRTKNNFVI